MATPPKDAQIVFDDAEAQEFIGGIIDKHKKISERHEEVVALMSAIVFRDIIQHFEKEEGPDGRWKAWSQNYRKFMASVGKTNNKILQDSGRLRGSFQPSNVRKVSDGILWFNNAKTGSGFPYAHAHNEGGPRLPQRKFMWISDQAMSDIETQILRYLGG